MEDDWCRECGLAEETGTHIALVCREMEGLGIAGRRFSSWEQVDDTSRVFQKQKIVDEFGKERVININLAESFFAELGDP